MLYEIKNNDICRLFEEKLKIATFVADICRHFEHFGVFFMIFLELFYVLGGCVFCSFAAKNNFFE